MASSPAVIHASTYWQYRSIAGATRTGPKPPRLRQGVVNVAGPELAFPRLYCHYMPVVTNVSPTTLLMSEVIGMTSTSIKPETMRAARVVTPGEQ